MKRLYDSPVHRATLDYCESGAYYEIADLPQAEIDEMNRAIILRARADEIAEINAAFSEAAEVNAAAAEIRRRLSKPAHWLDIVEIAEDIAAWRRTLQSLGTSEFWKRLELFNTAI